MRFRLPPLPPLSAPTRALRPVRRPAFSTSSACRRDLDAKYRYQPPKAPNEYFTSSTVPVSSSIQDVPPPSSAIGSDRQGTQNAPFFGRKAVTLPVMEPLHPEATGKPAGRTQVLRVGNVAVPPKPSPPGSEECCMSGCVNCVYTIYADDLLEYNESLATALSALRDSHTPLAEWPEEVRTFAEKSRKRHGETAGGRAPMVEDGEVGKVTREEIMRDVLVDVDPGLRAFLELENKIKARH